MKHMFKLSFFIVSLLLLSACSQYDYTLHKPVVRYKTPSKKALSIMLAETHGKRYRWAEEGPRSFDCSGLTYYSFGSMNLWLPRRTVEQARLGKTVSINELQYGDLIFFDTRRRSSGKINHVGIYVGKNRFKHASSSRNRVITTSLHKPYYRQRVVVCKRVIPEKKVYIAEKKPEQKPEKKKFQSIINENEKVLAQDTPKSNEKPIVAVENHNVYAYEPIIKSQKIATQTETVAESLY